MELEVASPLTEGGLKLDGVLQFKVKEQHIEFLSRGPVNTLVNMLDLNNVMITEPDLEEIFMHYYE